MRSSPGTFSLTSKSLIGSTRIHLRSHAVVIAWNATSFECYVLGELTIRAVNRELTEFMPEILRVDDGGRQWIRGVDVLTNHVSK